MITQDQVRHLNGATVYDRSGDRIGKVGGVYFDDRTDEPKWVTVQTGLFGTKETFVPVHDAELGDDRVTVAYEKTAIKDAPHIDEDGHLSPQEEEQLYRYYGLSYDDGDARATTETTATTGGRRTEGLVDHDRAGERDERDAGREDRDVVGRDASGRATDDAMTRSEEQLRVGTESREAGRARLRKRVVTEQQQVTVPVSHEEVTLEREPVTDTNRGAAHDGPAISEEEHEVTLHAERPVVDTEAVAVERVRLGKETVTEQQTVGGEVRKEEIDLDRGDTAADDVRTARRDRS